MEIQKKTRQLLVILAITIFFNGLVWSALIPMWHTPDEQAHFAQAQDFAALGNRPSSGFSTSADIVLSEKYLGVFRDERGDNRFTYHPEYNIEYSGSVYGLYEKELIAMPVESRSILSINEATGYPPLYYLYISAINRQFWSLDLISRVFLSRIVTVLLSVGLGLVVFNLGKILFKDIFYAHILAALVVFQPMRMFSGAGVTSDALYNLIYPLVILTGLLFYRHPSFKRLVLLLAAVLAGILTKQQFVLLFFWLVPMVLIPVFRENNQSQMLVKSAVIVGMIFGILFIIVNLLATFIPWLVGPLTSTILKSGGIPDVSTPMSNEPSILQYLSVITREGYAQILPWYWGVYRWLSLTLPFWVYRTIKVVMIISFLGWITGFKKIKNIVNGKLLLWLAGSSVIYTLGIYFWNLLFWKSHGFPFGIQGRYFFPNLTEHMTILLVGLILLSRSIISVIPVPDRSRGQAPAGIYLNRFRIKSGMTIEKIFGLVAALGMVLFNWFSLWFVSQSYYGDIFSYQTFFLRASQYKPWFFKTPLLEAWLGLGILTSVWFLLSLIRYTRKQDTRTQEH